MTETETKLHELMPRWAAQQPERCTPIPGTDGMYDLQLDEERILFAGDGTEFDAARAHAAVLEAVRAADDETQRAYLVHLVGLLPMTRVRTWRHFEVTSLTLALATTEQVLEAWVLTLEDFHCCGFNSFNEPLYRYAPDVQWEGNPENPDRPSPRAELDERERTGSHEARPVGEHIDAFINQNDD